MELPVEHQAVVLLSPVLWSLLSPGDGEVLCARAQSILYQHGMFAFSPSVLALLGPLSDGMGCGDMLGSFQDHCLEDNETLLFP